MSLTQFNAAGGSGLINRYGSLTKLLQTFYPEHQWDAYRFSKPHQLAKGKKFYSKTQYALLQTIKSVSNNNNKSELETTQAQFMKMIDRDVNSLVD